MGPGWKGREVRALAVQATCSVTLVKGEQEGGFRAATCGARLGELGALVVLCGRRSGLCCRRSAEVGALRSASCDVVAASAS